MFGYRQQKTQYHDEMRAPLAQCVFAAGMLLAVTAQAAPSLVDWGPKDMQRDVHQVSLRYSDDMVALGDDKATDAADIHCIGTNAVAKGHWLDGRRWVGEFAQPLADGVSCMVQPHALKTMAGAAMETPKPWSFNTGGARVQRDVVLRGSSGEVAELPLVALLPSAQVVPVSLKDLRCSINGQETRAEILLGTAHLAALDRLVPQQTNVVRSDAWLVAQCGSAPWPARARVEVNWGRNIATPTGLRNEVDQPFHYIVRSEFSAKIICSRLAGTQDCDPRQSGSFNTHVHFSEVIAPSVAKAIRLRGGSGAVYESDPIPRWFEQRIQDLSFHGDFANEASVRLEFPSDLKDVDGRLLSNPAALASPMAMAQLPAYVGMANRAGVLQWTPAHIAMWPIVTRAAGGPVKVHSWHFSPNTTNIASLLRLQAYAESGDKGTNPSSWELNEAFVTSAALLTSLHVAPPPVQEQELVPAGDGMTFTGLPLSGYGMWVVEADSPAFRAILEAQRKELVKRGLIDDESPKALYINVDTDGSVLIDGKRFAIDATLEAKLTSLAARPNENRPDFFIRSNLPQNDQALAATSTMLKRVGLDVKMVTTEFWPAGAMPRARHAEVVQAWIDSRVAVIQLTNLNVQFIASPNGDSLVWVTAFDTGSPVPNASVEVRSGARKEAKVYTTDTMGRVLLPVSDFEPRAKGSPDDRRTIVVRSGEDAAIVTGSMGNRYFDRAPIGHTILDRTLFHPGETMSMQHLARMPSKEGWAMPHLKGESKIRIFYGYESQPVAQLPLAWNEDGRAAGDWTIPQTAKLGHYRFEVVVNDNVTINRGDFQIEEFRPPVFDASLDAHASWRHERQSVDLSVLLSYIAGGAAAGQTVVLKGKYIIDASGPNPEYVYFQSPNPLPKIPEFSDIAVTLDLHGVGHARVAVPDFDLPLTLAAEMNFSDPNGETQSAGTRIAVWPHRHKLGLKLETAEGSRSEPRSYGASKAAARPAAKVNVILFDEKDQPLPNQRVRVDTINLAGEHTELCRVATDVKGKGTCDLPSDRDKDFESWSIEASASDASTGILSMRELGYFVSRVPEQAPMLELADHRKPELGKSLKVRARAPFLPATMLLAVEREGIFASEVHTLTTKEQIVEVPILHHYLPSVVLAAKFVRAGTGAHGSDNERDTLGADETLNVLFDDAAGKLDVDVLPAKKSLLPGASLPVTVVVKGAMDRVPAAGARLTIVAVDDALLALKPNRSWDVLARYWTQRYSDVRDSAIDTSWFHGHLFDDAFAFLPTVEQFLHFNHVAGNGGGDTDAPSPEFGSPMMGGVLARVAAAPAAEAKSIGVRGTMFESVQVTGSRMSATGTGEIPAPRTNFSTLAFWKTDLVLDGKGSAQFVIPMPDSLTRWRIVAIASTGTDRFGTGDAVVVTDQPVQIISGLPQTVRNDDVLVQKVTLRNTTGKPVALTLNGAADLEFDPEFPAAETTPPAAALAAHGLTFSRRLKLAGGENRLVEWQVAIPDGVKSLDWRIEAKTERGERLDVLATKQSVVPAVAVTARESTLFQIDRARKIEIAQPAAALPGRGGVAVRWQASLVDAAMIGARSWMAQYPYHCTEQLASIAAVSGDPAKWQEFVNLLPKVIDAQGLVRYFPETPGSEVLTAYLLDLTEAAHLALPAAEAKRMHDALRSALQREVAQADRQWLTDKGLLPRRLALQASIAPDLGAIAPTVPPELDALPTIALLDWTRYLQKMPESAENRAALDKAADNLRNRFDMQGTRLTLRHDGNDNWWWFMWNADVAEARAALLVQRSMAGDARWKDLIPSLITSLVDRQKNGHWATTVANAWAAVALQEFARSSESGAVTGTSEASYGNDRRHAKWPNAAPSLFAWPQQGARAELNLRHDGDGAPWAAVQVLAAVNTTAPIAHGVAVARSVEPVEQRVKGKWSVGDAMRVTLTMRTDADLSWLVVRDPIPSGATILGKGLGRESQLASGATASQWWRYPSSAELGSESYRGYYQFVWQGEWKAVYVVRLNNAGTFTLPATRIEAMYAPEIFGESPIEELQVAP
ncbi:MAG TPA: MG2 domain-containing protein [Burkholderiaceae bacterium]|jgi:hypothetical protein